MRTPSPLLLLTLPFSLLACGNDAPAPSEVRERIANDLGHVLRESEAAGARGEAAVPTGAAFGLIERFVPSETRAFAKRSVPGVLSGWFAKAGDLPQLEGAATPVEGEGIADELIEELNTKLFTDANHLGDGIYKVPADYACTEETFHDDGSITTAIDPECAQQWDQIQLRVRVATEDDTLVLGLQVGANHDEPLRFALTHTSLALTIDLDESGQAMQALAPVFGEAAPNASLSGQITGKLEVLGEASARVALTFDRPLSIKVGEAGIALDGPDAFRFSSAAANVASISFDGVAGTGAVVIDLGETRAHVPGEVEFEEPAVDLDLPGASVIAMLAANEPLRLTHVGLGERTTTLTIDGQQAVALDLNPNDGRAFGAILSHDATTGLDTIEVSPVLDFRSTVDHAALGEEAPVYDVTRVLLTGALRTGAASDRIEVVSGSFGITTNPAEFGFTATAGQCVTSTFAEDVSTGQFYDQWLVGSCN
jgi:hypothetical protein